MKRDKPEAAKASSTLVDLFNKRSCTVPQEVTDIDATVVNYNLRQVRYRYVTKKCYFSFPRQRGGTLLKLFKFSHFGSAFQAAVFRYCRDPMSASPVDHIGIDAFEVKIVRFLGGNRSRALQGSVKEQYNGVRLQRNTLLQHFIVCFVGKQHQSVMLRRKNDIFYFSDLCYVTVRQIYLQCYVTVPKVLMNYGSLSNAASPSKVDSTLPIEFWRSMSGF